MTVFSERLQKLTVQKGWTYAELARRAEKHMPKDNPRFGRDTISRYIRGVAMPTPVSLDALCKALNVKPEDLLPGGTRPSSRNRKDLMPFSMEYAGEGNVWVKINMGMPMEKAIEIARIIGHPTGI